MVKAAHRVGPGLDSHEDSAPRIHRRTKAGALEKLRGEGGRAQRRKISEAPMGMRREAHLHRDQRAARAAAGRTEKTLTRLRDDEEEHRGSR